MHLFRFIPTYHFNPYVKKGYICTHKWVAFTGSRQCCMQQQVLKAKEGSNSTGIRTSAAWLSRSWSCQVSQLMLPMSIFSSPPLPLCLPRAAMHQVWLSPGSMQPCWHKTAGWCSCSPVKQMLLSQQRIAAGWLVLSCHHWHQLIFSTIHLQISKWMTGTSYPACHQSGLRFVNISNYLCARKNGVLEPTSPLGFLHVVSSGATLGNAWQHHRRHVAVRSTSKKFCCRENERQQQQLYSSSRASFVLTLPAPILGLSSSKAPFGINWSVLCFSLTQLFSTATDDWTQEGM